MNRILLTFIGTSVIFTLTGCQMLAQNSEPALPSPTIPEDWQIYKMPDAGISIGGPKGWEFETARGKQQIGSGLFTPAIDVPTGTAFVWGQRLDDESLSKGGAGMITIERKAVDDHLKPQTIRANEQKNTIVDLMSILGGTPQVQEEMIDLPVGKTYRVLEEYQDGSLNVTYYLIRKGKLTKVSFANFSDKNQKAIPSKRMMETLRFY